MSQTKEYIFNHWDELHPDDYDYEIWVEKRKQEDEELWSLDAENNRFILQDGTNIESLNHKKTA
jgi:hypothetical protein